MKKSIQLLLFFCLLALATTEPGRRRGGSRKSGGIGGGGWFGTNRNNNWGNRNNNWGNRNNKNQGGWNKKKGLSTLKKAAVLGAVGYGGYQLGKLSSRFSMGGMGMGGYGFNDWNRWRRQDGFLCRDTRDCSWIDPSLYCQDYELDFKPSAMWFGGDVARIVGECECGRGMTWDDYEMQCRTAFFGGIVMALITLVGVAIMLCCCAGAIFVMFRRYC